MTAGQIREYVAVTSKWRAKIIKRWRLVLLLLAVVVSVTVPYLFTRSTTNSALDASRWVATSAQVRVTVYRLLYRLRDIEAATYSVLQGVRSDDIKQRIQRSAEQIDPLLATLRGLTLDNANQQARLGALKSVVEHRVRLMRQARTLYAAGNPGAAYRALGKAANVFPYSALAEDIVHAEKRMQARRDTLANHKTWTARLVQTGAALAQLLLLGLVAVLAERAAAHRLRAERISRHAVARAQRIVQTVREPMAILDGDLNLVMVNAAFEELYGDTGAVGADTRAARHELSDVGNGAWSDEALRQRLVDVLARDRELWDYELAQTTMDGVDRH